MDSAKTRSFPTLLLASAAVLTGGVFVVALYGWLLTFHPDTAKQLTAVFVITSNVMVAFVNPLAGFLLWLFLSPFALFLPFNIAMPAGIPDLSYDRMMVGFLSLYLLAKIASGKRRLPSITAIDAAIPIFIFILAIAGVRASNGWLWGIQTVFDSYVMPLLVYFIARLLITNRKQFQALALTLLAIGSIIAGLAILEQTVGIELFRPESLATSYGGTVRKVGGLLGNPAYIALALAVIIPLSIAGAVRSTSTRSRLVYLAVFLLLEIGIFFTYNRSGWAGGVLAVLVFAFLNRKVARVALPIMLVAAIVLGATWFSLQDSAFAGRLTAESPVDYRLQALEVGLKIHAQEPVFGVGWGSYGRIAVQQGFHSTGHVHVLPSPHNTYLNLLVAGGYLLLGGFLLLVASLAFTLVRFGLAFRRARQPIPLYLAAAGASFFAYYIPSAAFDNNFAIYANIVFWAIMGGIVSIFFYELSALDAE